MSTQSDFQFLADDFAERLVSDLEVPSELAEQIRELPMRTDGNENVRRMRAEWIAHCAKVARGEFT